MGWKYGARKYKTTINEKTIAYPKYLQTKSYIDRTEYKKVPLQKKTRSSGNN
jgi:hypothetical protein